MNPAGPAQEHEMRLMKAGAAAVLAVVCLGMAIALLLVSRAIDESALKDEQALVERRIVRSLGAISEDITSASIWNDAVIAIEGGDMEWLQVNFGDYYADYMDHSVTLVFDADDRLLLASRDSERVGADSEAALIAATQSMRAEVFRQSRDPRRRQAIGFEAVATRSASCAPMTPSIWSQSPRSSRNRKIRSPGRRGTPWWSRPSRSRP